MTMAMPNPTVPALGGRNETSNPPDPAPSTVAATRLQSKVDAPRWRQLGNEERGDHGEDRKLKIQDLRDRQRYRCGDGRSQSNLHAAHRCPQIRFSKCSQGSRAYAGHLAEYDAIP